MTEDLKISDITQGGVGGGEKKNKCFLIQY